LDSYNKKESVIIRILTKLLAMFLINYTINSGPPRKKKDSLKPRECLPFESLDGCMLPCNFISVVLTQGDHGGYFAKVNYKTQTK
jgi:hypothetical protein